MSTSPFNTVLDDVNPDDDSKRRARVYLLAMRLTGQLDDDGMSEIGQALGLFACPEVDARAPRGHIKGDHLRAVPVDWKRTGAVGIS